jgi:hypothetical protein
MPKKALFAGLFGILKLEISILVSRAKVVLGNISNYKVFL